MEGVAGNAPCEHFEANVLAQRCCQNCFHPEEAHRARHQEPGSPPSAEAPYCDLPRRPAAPEDPLRASTSNCQSVVGSGLGPGPERWVEPWGLRRGSRGWMPSPIPPHTPS
uniref:TRIO and F-actin-binding protein n=1 Tax=Balaenoptera musculus TaxID=9771 RepID=A0A8C0CYB1_BALMU